MNYGDVLIERQMSNYIPNLEEIKELLCKTFDLEQLKVDEEPLSKFTIFRFRFKRNKNIGCQIDNSQIAMRNPKDTARYISHIVIDELFKSKGE